MKPSGILLDEVEMRKPTYVRSRRLLRALVGMESCLRAETRGVACMKLARA